MLTDEIRKKAYLSPNIGKRGKAKKTLEKEELRQKFTQYFGERFLILLKQLEKAIKKENIPATLEILRQLIGSADNKIDITSGGKNIVDILKYGLKSNTEHNEAGSAGVPSEGKTDAS